MLTLSHPETLPSRVKSSGVRQRGGGEGLENYREGYNEEEQSIDLESLTTYRKCITSYKVGYKELGTVIMNKNFIANNPIVCMN